MWMIYRKKKNRMYVEKCKKMHVESVAGCFVFKNGPKESNLNKAGEEPPVDVGSICLPLVLEELLHLLILSVSSADSDTEGPQPPNSPDDNSRKGRADAEGTTLSQPAALCEVREGETHDEEH